MVFRILFRALRRRAWRNCPEASPSKSANRLSAKTQRFCCGSGAGGLARNLSVVSTVRVPTEFGHVLGTSPTPPPPPARCWLFEVSVACPVTHQSTLGSTPAAGSLIWTSSNNRKRRRSRGPLTGPNRLVPIP